jgi:sugar diacid utilization regulator
LTSEGRMWRKYMAIFIIGAIIGAVITSTWQAKDMENLFLQVRKLTLHNDELAEENARLSMETSQPQKVALIKSVQVDCINRGNDWAVTLAATDSVKEELSFLVGKDLDVLIHNPDLPARILNGQSFSVDNKRYHIKVALVVISETVYVQIQASSLNE